MAGNTLTSAPLSITIESIAPASAAALNFDGSNDYISVPNSATNNFAAGKEFTIEFWAKVDVNGGSRAFVGKGAFAGGDEQYAFDHYSNQFRFYVESATANSFTVLTMPVITVANGWVHVAGTFSGNTGEMRLYRNGVLAGQSNSAVSTLAPALNPTTIGTQFPGATSVDGSMDEVRFWSRALCQAEIQANMNCELNPVGQVGLGALYHFNQGDAAGSNAGETTLTDASGNASNGTLVNFALNGASSNWIEPGAVVTGTTCALTDPYLCYNVWDGSSSTAWATAANWSYNTVPVLADDIMIPNVANDPVISTSVYVGDITLQSGAPLSVSSGGTLTLEGTLQNSGVVTIQNGGSFLQGAGSGITGSGTFSIQRQGGSYYNMWSSPITSQSGVPGTSYAYNSAASTQDDSDDQPSDPGWGSYNGVMTAGVGYAGFGGNLATFTGTPNNGNINRSLFFSAFDNTYTAASGGTPFNLVGNPYPSAISAASFIAANGDLDGTIYLWNDNGSNNYSRTDYAYWNGTGGLGTGGGPIPNGNIGTAQGFMVRALSGGAVANFTNAQRVVGNNIQFHKTSAEDSRMWFSVEKDNMRDEVLIGMLIDATEDEDRMYDAVKLKGNSDLSFSTLSANTEYAILAVPPISEERTIQLNLELEQSGTYRFIPNTMENMEGYHVYFVDAQTGLNVLLEEGTPVDVAIEAGEYTNRFYLNFITASITGVNNNHTDQLTIYSSSDMLHVNNSGAAEANAVIELMDMSGRIVLSKQLNLASGNSTTSIEGLSNGVYLVHINTATKTITHKITKQ